MHHLTACVTAGGSKAALTKHFTKSFVCLFVCGVKPHGSSYMRFSCCTNRCAVLTQNNVDLGLPPCLMRAASLPSLGNDCAGVLLAFLMGSILLKSHFSSWLGLPCCASPRMRCSELKMRLFKLISAVGWEQAGPRAREQGLSCATWPQPPSAELRTRGWSIGCQQKLIKAALDMLILSRELCHNVKAKYRLQSVS